MNRVRRSAAVAGSLLVATGLLAGCGSSPKPHPKAAGSPSAPSASAMPSVKVPSGVTLTKQGSTLKLGQSATVPYQPNAKQSTVLQLTVSKVKAVSMKAFRGYQLDSRTMASTPYFVTVGVKNVGKGTVGGQHVPLWAVNQSNVLVDYSTFSNQFAKCPSPPMPAKVRPGTKFKTCLVYLIPSHGRLTQISYRPQESFRPIVWPYVAPKPKPKPKPSKKASAKPSGKPSAKPSAKASGKPSSKPSAKKSATKTRSGSGQHKATKKK